MSGLIACGPQLKTAEHDESIKVELSCVPIEGAVEEDIYRYTVHVTDGKQSQAVMLIPTCSPIAAADYQTHQVPADAITAISSWWAGSGDYVYAIPKEDGVLIRRATVDEMQLVRDYGYMDWAFWRQGTLVMYDANTVMPISGLYMAEEEAASYLFLLDKIGEEWQAEALELKGMLPAKEDLRMELESMNLQKVSGFELNPETGQFSAGEWGEGELVMEKGRCFLVFKERQGAKGEPLKLALRIR